MMDWVAIFGATNLVALLGWIALLVLPRTERTLGIIFYAAVGLLCLVYLAMAVAMVGGWIDSARPAGTPPPNLLDYTIEGLQNLFVSKGGLVLGWTHYLALDLFTGWWIGQDADRVRIGRLAQVPILLATFMAGPIGLLIWLGLRNTQARNAHIG